MVRNINSLIGYSVKATDGTIGIVDDFYFDDETWTIRYLIVKTGHASSARKMLMTPGALVKNGITPDVFSVNLTMDQILKSPDIDTDKPVSRQREAIINQHHHWENYWGSDSYAGEAGFGNFLPIDIEPDDKDRDEDIHLRSIDQVCGYAIYALDGEIGHVSDFMIDDKTWRLLKLVVDTHDWIGGKKVLIGLSHIQSISFIDKQVYLNLTTAAINDSHLFEEAEHNEH